ARATAGNIYLADSELLNGIPYQNTPIKATGMASVTTRRSHRRCLARYQTPSTKGTAAMVSRSAPNACCTIGGSNARSLKCCQPLFFNAPAPNAPGAIVKPPSARLEG